MRPSETPDNERGNDHEKQRPGEHEPEESEPVPRYGHTQREAVSRPAPTGENERRAISYRVPDPAAPVRTQSKRRAADRASGYPNFAVQAHRDHADNPRGRQPGRTDRVVGPLLFFAVVWVLAWRRYNRPDGTLVDLVVWLSVGAFVYLTGAWLLFRLT